LTEHNSSNKGWVALPRLGAPRADNRECGSRRPTPVSAGLSPKGAQQLIDVRLTASGSLEPVEHIGFGTRPLRVLKPTTDLRLSNISHGSRLTELRSVPFRSAPSPRGLPLRRAPPIAGRRRNAQRPNSHAAANGKARRRRKHGMTRVKNTEI